MATPGDTGTRAAAPQERVGAAGTAVPDVGTRTPVAPAAVAQTFQVRFHGRGGQGVVTAAELLSVAVFLEGRHAQAFPSFGSERAGAPVAAFCRMSGAAIRTREPVLEPDAVVVQDATLLGQGDLLSGLRPGGFLLVNTALGLERLGLGDATATLPRDHVATVAATDVARRLIGRPVPNAALLGGLAALTGVVTLDALTAAIEERFAGRTGAGNVAAATEVFADVLRAREELRVAPPA